VNIFYAPDIEGGIYKLNRTESRHTVRVLRMRKNTVVKLTDGRGTLYTGVIEDPDPDQCTIAITSAEHNFEKRDYHLHIAISPLKNPDRFEWFVEKVTEIGVDEITPLICEYSEKKSVKAERIENIITSAMKQSLKAFRPLLNQAVQFNDFIKTRYQGTKYIATCDNSVKRILLKDRYKKGDDAIILIGPEGDFSSPEVRMASEAEFIPSDLGKVRMRTETAGVAACHSIYFMNL